MNTIVCHIPDVTKMLSALLDILSLDGLTVAVVVDADLLERLSGPDLGLQAALFPSAADASYRLVLDRRRPARTVLCHEMVHLDQYVSGRLSLLPSGFLWEGRAYSAGLPYDRRPWEREAFARERDLLAALRRAVKE